MTEDQLQKQVADYLRLQHPNLLWFHPANGGSRHPAEAAKLKGMGVRPGVSDLLVFWPTGMGAIELKVGKNKMTDTQKIFAQQWMQFGGKFAECRSLDDVIDTLKDWLAK